MTNSTADRSALVEAARIPALAAIDEALRDSGSLYRADDPTIEGLFRAEFAAPPWDGDEPAAFLTIGVPGASEVTVSRSTVVAAYRRVR